LKRGKALKDRKKESDSEKIIYYYKQKEENKIKMKIKGKKKKTKDNIKSSSSSSHMNLRRINRTIKNLNRYEKDNITENIIRGNNRFSNNYNKLKNEAINEDKKSINKQIKKPETGYFLIQIDANNSCKNIPLESYILLDNYNYKDAIKYDKRSFSRILLICILTKGNIINILFFRTPLDLLSLRIILFIFQYSCDLAFNAIFYSNESISEKYHYEGNNIFVFSIIYNNLQSLISYVISDLIVLFLQYMIDIRSDFEDIFKKEEEKLRKNKEYKVNQDTKLKINKKIKKIYKKFRYKIVIFLISEIILMFFFYYFVTAFCEIYNQTQLSWLYDFLDTVVISLVGEFVLSLVLSALYIVSIRHKVELFYKVVLFVYNM
jgi:hypothetical protein